jgi:N-acetyl-D-muramate 6-phosphate phosphatase
LRATGVTTKAVLFDLDGTLVDTAPDLGGAANHLRAQHGMEPLPMQAYRQHASAGARGMIRTALGITPEHTDFMQLREEFLDHYARNISRNSKPFDEIAQLLDDLETRGIAWGIVTNKPRIYTDVLLRDLGLHTRPAVIVSPDDVGKKAKPAPDGLLYACQKLDCTPAECVYVGDDKRDADAARAAGMRFIAVAWGYEGDHPLASWNADATIETPTQLLEHL